MYTNPDYISFLKKEMLKLIGKQKKGIWGNILSLDILIALFNLKFKLS